MADNIGCKDCQFTGWVHSGASGSPACPKCRNSFQNAVPHGSPHLRRCATCKHVWEPVKCLCTLTADPAKDRP